MAGETGTQAPEPGVPASPAGRTAYVDPSYGFSIGYPNGFVVQRRDTATTQPSALSFLAQRPHHALFRLRYDPYIRLLRCPSLREFLLCFLVRDRRHDDHIFARLPIHGRGTLCFAVN